jgi:hypothetical protein
VAEDRTAAQDRCPYCGWLRWTIDKYGRVTHKQACPHRTDPWHQGDPTAAKPTKHNWTKASVEDLLARNRQLWLALECAADLLGNDGYADDPDYAKDWKQISEALDDA